MEEPVVWVFVFLTLDYLICLTVVTKGAREDFLVTETQIQNAFHGLSSVLINKGSQGGQSLICFSGSMASDTQLSHGW